MLGNPCFWVPVLVQSLTVCALALNDSLDKKKNSATFHNYIIYIDNMQQED